MSIQIFENIEQLNKSFTELIKKTLSDNNRVTIALSGGSTPKAIFKYWAENHRSDIDWQSVFLFWGDERCVPPTDDQSNYKMTKESLIDHVPIPSKNIFRIKGENNPVAEAKRYSNVLEMEVDMVNDFPSFDLVILGMGDDGHTASIFPNQMELWDSNEYCVVASHPESGQKRVSITGGVINNAKRVAFLVTGANKAEKIKLILGKSSPEIKNKFPAAKVDPTSGNLDWYLDKDSAKLL